MTLTLTAEHAVTPGGVVDRARLTLDGGTIQRIEAGVDADGDGDHHATWLLPGAVDLHCHGGGGADLGAADLDEVRVALGFHRARGTTTSLVSLVSAPLTTLRGQLRRLAAWLADPATGLADTVAGIHLEGPFLATRRCGAIDPTTMIDADPGTVDDLIDAAGGWLRIITVAPERPGVLEAIPRLVRAGVVVAVGHTDATTDQVHAAIDAGASMATHLGNAMAPFHHRRPGPVGACLAHPGVTAELIVDGHHLHPDTVALAVAAKGPGAVTFATDAVAAAGTGDGAHTFDGRRVTVTDGAVRLDDTGALAGSTLTMDRAVANGVGWGLGAEQVARATATNPARLIGLADRGRLEAGARADLVCFDADWKLTAVYTAGTRVAAPAD